MKVKGTVGKRYDIDAGEYIGVPYKNMDVVINEEREEGKPYSRMAFRIKGEHLERFLREGIGNDHRSHTFELIADVDEKEWKKDGKVHPSNRIPVCIAWE